jgi:Transcriptional regulator PadR-like family
MLTFRERSTSTKCEIDRHSRLIAGDQKLVGTTAIPKPTGSQIERGSLYPALHRLEARGWSSTDKPKSAPSNRLRQFLQRPRNRSGCRPANWRWR